MFFYSRTVIDFKFEAVTDLLLTIVRNVKTFLENIQHLVLVRALNSHKVIKRRIWPSVELCPLY